MVLSSEWSQLEVIDLVNDGSGLGFGIVGGRSTGVVIKSILPGGLADKDSRLQSGDHILQIGEINCRGLSADQVATVLRQTGSQVRMVVARSVEPSSLEFRTYGSSAPVVPTKLLTDPDEMDRLQNGYLEFFNQICVDALSPNIEQVLSSHPSPRIEAAEGTERTSSPNIATCRVSPSGDLLFNIVEFVRTAKKTENLDAARTEKAQKTTAQSNEECDEQVPIPDDTIDSEVFEESGIETKQKLNIIKQSSLSDWNGLETGIIVKPKVESVSEVDEFETYETESKNKLQKIKKSSLSDWNGLESATVFDTQTQNSPKSSSKKSSLSESINLFEGKSHNSPIKNSLENKENIALNITLMHGSTTISPTKIKPTIKTISPSAASPRKSSLEIKNNIYEAYGIEKENSVETIKNSGSFNGLADNEENVNLPEVNGGAIRQDGDGEENVEDECQEDLKAIGIISKISPELNVLSDHNELHAISENLKPKEARKPNGISKTKAIDQSCDFIEINDGTRVIQINELYVQSINFSNNIISNKTGNPHDYHSNNSTSVKEFPLSPSQVIVTPVDVEYQDLPETKRFSVELTKNAYGLGITVAGYVCEKEDLNGIFVKDLCEKSEAFTCGKIRVHDRIIEVNGQLLLELSNPEAVKKLRETGAVVKLTFERYLRGPKFEQLQEALAIEERRASTPRTPPSTTTLSWIPIDNNHTQIIPDPESGHTNVSEIIDEQQNPEYKEIFIEENFVSNLETDLETNIKGKWESILGGDANVVVCNLTKLTGLGISLEGTVDVEGGVELRPRHFIRSILPEGPVGQNGKLSPGDELLEVNGQKLLGLKHVEVVKILRELPNTVRLVCSRTENDNRVINTSQDREAFEQRNILGGSLKNLLLQPDPKMVKSLSDTSIHTNSNNSSNSITVSDEHPANIQLVKSRSMENTSVTLWNDEVEYIELLKQDRGLGFSILDYQDPLNPRATIIVVRGLIPNGPAELDGRLKVGDQIVSVNGRNIKNFSLDQAVQELKGTLPGFVTLGIAKPLTETRSQGISEASKSLKES